jgi:hypothetical protein
MDKGARDGVNRAAIQHMMKTCTLAFIGALFIAVISGCTTPSAAMQRFVGQPSTELIAQRGPPQQRTPDGQGGEIWSYFEQRQWTTLGQVNTAAYATGNSYGNLETNPYGATYYGNANVRAAATTTYTPPQTRGYTAHRSFFIDSNGIVYRWAWKGI